MRKESRIHPSIIVQNRLKDDSDIKTQPPSDQLTVHSRRHVVLDSGASTSAFFAIEDRCVMRGDEGVARQTE